jgi:beta-xylosidase
MRPLAFAGLLAVAVLSTAGQRGAPPPAGPGGPWTPDLGTGRYRNPVIFADYSDPDVVRAGNDFYLVASSFNVTPALPILRSPDLVNWTIVGHAAPRLPSPRYDVPQHGGGVWAPSLRVHNNRFWIYFGDPDLGIFMTSAADPRGPWDPLTLVHEARGWIDPCPLWDDDGQMYLVHAWAKSRAGFNGVLTVRRLTADGRKLADDVATNVFDGGTKHPTIEGPKFYKRNGYYYIFAPAGGVPNGWQTVLRSRNVLGPYEDRIVLARGGTAINGPHQGGWVQTAAGESWFVHFQDRGAYGRIVHVQPLTWRGDDWPVIGADPDGDGTGEPVETFRKPVATTSRPVAPQTSDELNGRDLGLQWQWQANPKREWWSLNVKPGVLRLFSQPIPGDGTNLWNAPHLLMQKLPAESFEVTASVSLTKATAGESISLVAFGLDYGLIRITTRTGGGWSIEQVVCRNASEGTSEQVVAAIQVEVTHGESFDEVLRLTVANGEVRFSHCPTGLPVTDAICSPLGDRMRLREGRWMGAKFGLVATRPAGSPVSKGADIDWVRVK